MHCWYICLFILVSFIHVIVHAIVYYATRWSCFVFFERGHVSNSRFPQLIRMKLKFLPSSCISSDVYKMFIQCCLSYSYVSVHMVPRTGRYEMGNISDTCERNFHIHIPHFSRSSGYLVEQKHTGLWLSWNVMCFPYDKTVQDWVPIPEVYTVHHYVVNTKLIIRRGFYITTLPCMLHIN